MVKCCGFVEFRCELGKICKKVEICKKFSTKCGVSFIIWRFPFPDGYVTLLQGWFHSYQLHFLHTRLLMHFSKKLVFPWREIVSIHSKGFETSEICGCRSAIMRQSAQNLMYWHSMRQCQTHSNKMDGESIADELLFNLYGIFNNLLVQYAMS
jgi:hypothetical protein